jgi:hypothetical protein
MRYAVQLLPICVSTSTGTRGPPTSGPLSTLFVPSIMAFSSQATTFSASLLLADAVEDPSRSGYPSDAVFRSPEALDNNSVFLGHYCRAFAR